MTARPWVLGIGSGYHNGAACLLHGHEIVVAIQEERLTRIKRDRVRHGKRSLAIEYCLRAAGITPRDLDAIVDCPIAIPGAGPRDRLEDSWLVAEARGDVQLHTIPHHAGHAISAYATSGFSDAIAIVIDGGGTRGADLPEAERQAAVSFDDDMYEHLSIYRCSPAGVVPVEKHLSFMPYLLHKPAGMAPFASLGHMFSSAAAQIFDNYLEAGKVMALAPYGRASIPMEEFLTYDGTAFTFSDRATRRFDHDARWPACAEAYQDLAASVQHVLEVTLQQIFETLERMAISDRCCYAGGVALNSVANHQILAATAFADVHILAAAEDCGTAIGAAHYGLQRLSGAYRAGRLGTDYLGRRYSPDEIDDAIDTTPGVVRIATTDVADTAADLLCQGKVLAWFCEESEFGPRALGHRSILCDPRLPGAKQLLNERVKGREAFRPFAPAVLDEEITRWFDVDGLSGPMEFMLDVCPFRDPLPGPAVPGVLHVDGSGRVQAVTEHGNRRLYDLLRRFYERTGVPMLVNTSLNIMGEPIVETPRQALWLLLTTGVDYCVLEQRIVAKASWFRSPIDLVPYKTCEVFRHDGGARVRAITEHGPVEYGNAPAELLTALDHIDGVSTAREIFQKADGRLGPEAAAIRGLGLLVRYSAVRLRAPREPQAGVA